MPCLYNYGAINLNKPNNWIISSIVKGGEIGMVCSSPSPLTTVSCDDWDSEAYHLHSPFLWFSTLNIFLGDKNSIFILESQKAVEFTKLNFGQT